LISEIALIVNEAHYKYPIVINDKSLGATRCNVVKLKMISDAVMKVDPSMSRKDALAVAKEQMDAGLI